MSVQHQAFLIAIYIAGGIALFRALLAQRRRRPLNPEAMAMEMRGKLRQEAARREATKVLGAFR